MKIIVVKACSVNVAGGYSTTIKNTIPELEKLGHQMFSFEMDGVDCDAENKSDVKKLFAEFYEEIQPNAIHIANIARQRGLVAKEFCIENDLPFTTSFINNYEALKLRKKIHYDLDALWKNQREFHEGTSRIHVVTPSLREQLISKGFQQEIVHYPRGINFNDFYYDEKANSISGYPRPFFMTMSRISPEKNLEAFLELDLPGTKFVIGEGRNIKYRKKLIDRYDKKAIFLAYKNVAAILSQGDVFVCPSKTETFGLVMIEAMACGLPIAAYPVMGPKDIIKEGVTGYLNNNLKKAAMEALRLKKEDCIYAAKPYSWAEHAKNFLKYLQPIYLQ